MRVKATIVWVFRDHVIRRFNNYNGDITYNNHAHQSHKSGRMQTSFYKEHWFLSTHNNLWRPMHILYKRSCSNLNNLFMHWCHIGALKSNCVKLIEVVVALWGGKKCEIKLGSKARNLHRPCLSLSVWTKSLGIETLIPMPLDFTTNGIEDGLNGKERGCEVVEICLFALYSLFP